MTLPTSGPLTFSDIQTEFGGTNPIGMNEYYAGGGIVPAGTSGTYGAVPSSGQISVQNFYGTTAFTPIYIEEVFSPFIYNGITGSNVTINNGINLSSKGGLIWTKGRNLANPNSLTDTTRGVSFQLNSATTSEQSGSGISSFTSTGYVTNQQGQTNGGTGEDYVSWTFRKQPKFFDIVTWTGDGASGRTLSHNLGAVPAWIIIKRTSSAGTNWVVTAIRGIAGEEYYLNLNLQDAGTQGTTGPAANGYALIGGGSSDTGFNIYSGSSGNSAVNASGATYVAYLFASNAGGFGATGTDNVIACGSCVADGSGNFSATVGFEPQWVIIKGATASSRWDIFDNARGVTSSSGYSEAQRLNANLSDAEDTMSNPYGLGISSTGFTGNIAQAFGNTLVYMAIRRGPMKVPTSGTSVFMPSTASTGTLINTGFPVDLWIGGSPSGDAGAAAQITVDRLRGPKYFGTSTTAVENGTNNSLTVAPTNTFTNITQGGATRAEWLFGRAPGFMDVVCYTGNGVNGQTYAHKLGVTPELIIVKARNSARSWPVYPKTLSGGLYLNLTGGFSDYGTRFTSVSSTTFGVTADETTNFNTYTYVAYLFASLAGVSKVALITHAEPTTVVCGFVPRYIWIKSTENTGTNDWFVFDSARGITAGNDPYLRLNSNAAQNTPYGAADLVDLTSDGFIMNGFGGGSYLILAIA